MIEKTCKILMDIRKENKLSRKALSELSGFNEQTIFSYERRARKPSKEYIKFMSLYFNVNEDYINGVSEDKKQLTDIYRVFEMYRDIYNYSYFEMANLLSFNKFGLNKEHRYLELLKMDLQYPQPIKTSILSEALESLNIKPSSIEFDFEKALKVEKDKRGEKFYNEERPKNIIHRINSLEEKGIKIDKIYYAENIKRRNLAKINYKPNEETKKIPTKYKDILDLLPFAPEKFINDIHKKLKAFRELQKIEP